jgi:hypothetical protein
MVGRDDVDGLDLDYQLEDDVRNFTLPDVGEHHIALRFSSHVKDLTKGFTFGRNSNLCDICLSDDPYRRLSNIHFRIFLNEWGVLMLEDQSTNGTVVDGTLLRMKGNPPTETMRTLSSGSKIKVLMHEESRDIVFIVRIPLRDGQYHVAYQRNLEAYMANRANAPVDANETIVPGPGGHVRPSFAIRSSQDCIALTVWTRWTSSNPLPQSALLSQSARPTLLSWPVEPKWLINVQNRITRSALKVFQERGTAQTSTIACAR